MNGGIYTKTICKKEKSTDELHFTHSHSFNHSFIRSQFTYHHYMSSHFDQSLCGIQISCEMICIRTKSQHLYIWMCEFIQFFFGVSLSNMISLNRIWRQLIINGAVTMANKLKIVIEQSLWGWMGIQRRLIFWFVVLFYLSNFFGSSSFMCIDSRIYLNEVRVLKISMMKSISGTTLLLFKKYSYRF